MTITVNPAGAPAIEVHLIDPYLLDAYHTNPAKISEGSLFGVYNRLDVQANGLVADGVSAAIAVVKTNDCSVNASLTTTNRTTLLLYDAKFLTNPPVQGTAALNFPAADLLKNGGFGVALIQAPIGGPAPSFTNVVVTAQQGSQTAQAQASLVPPPVVLVHGIWGDKTSLAGVASYLNENIPLVGDLGLVQALCYSKYFKFDAGADPLSGGSDPCEQTSKDAIAGTINGLLSTLDSFKIVGSRVDVVAHSMGGLAARWYAAQKSYRSLRDRNQGQFHEIISLDTPELGSALAPFLDNHSSCTRQVSDPLNLDYIVWGVFCRSVSLSTTVRQCFENSGHPLAAPGSDLTTGAVYSLYPNGPSLLNRKLPPPNIPNADWRAVGANAPFNGALEADLNGLIAAIYPQDSPNCRAPGTAPLVYQILGDTNEDAVVTVSSQLAGAQANHFHTFQGLSHIEGVAIPGFGLSSDNVLDCQDVNQLVACWLFRSGDSACLAGVPDTPVCLTQASPSKASSPNKNAGLPASITPVSASKTAPANGNAVPMPHIVVAHPHFVDRLTLRVPAGLELGTPFELAVTTGSGGLPELQVAQTSETGSSKAVPAAISRVEGQTVYLSVPPKFFGTTRFQVSAAHRDGGVASKEVATNVNLPSRPPAQFHADTFQVTAIRLDLDNPSLRLQPWAIYANIPGRVYLDARYVSYSIAPSVGPPVVSLDPNGVVHGLRKGTATIIGRFGSLTGQVRVNVEAEQR